MALPCNPSTSLPDYPITTLTLYRFTLPTCRHSSRLPLYPAIPSSFPFSHRLLYSSIQQPFHFIPPLMLLASSLYFLDLYPSTVLLSRRSIVLPFYHCTVPIDLSTGPLFYAFIFYVYILLSLFRFTLLLISPCITSPIYPGIPIPFFPFPLAPLYHCFSILRPFYATL